MILHLVNIFNIKSNVLEAIKVMVLIAGITFGIFYDLTSSDNTGAYELHNKSGNQYNTRIVNNPSQKDCLHTTNFSHKITY